MSYFHFSRGKKIGVVVLSSLILILVVLLNVNNHVALPNPFGEVVDTVFIEQDTHTINNYSYNNPKDNQTKLKTELSNFNPNELGMEGWVTKGFSSKQAKSIVDYHAKFGPFKSAADVKKIYVISDDKFNEIEPFMVFGINTMTDKEKININTASNDELESIHGIGAYYAKQIIEYRDKLGGYISNNQFEEIQGMREESLVALKENVSVDNNQIIKLKINTISKDELKAHPYFKDWAIVTSIIKKRDTEKLTSMSFLIDEGLVNEEELIRMKLYIDYN